MSRRSVWNVAALALVAGMALTASACGGGDSAEGAQVASLGGSSTQSETETTTTGASEDPEEILLDYTECMRNEGIDVPDPDFSETPRGGFRIQLGTNDPDDPKFQAAREKCEPILASLRQQFDPAEQEERQEAALAFAKCMREHGIDIPDPDFSGGGPSRRGEGGPFGNSGIDPDDPDFRAAQEECQEVFGELGGPFRTQGRDGDRGSDSGGGDDE